MKRICVLVTGVGGGSIGHQILHGLLLAGEKYKIVACDADSFAFGLYQVANRYIVPRADDPQYIEALLRVIRKEGVEALLPGSEIEGRMLSNYKETIENAGCVLIANPKNVVEQCESKSRIAFWLEKNGFDTPKTVSSIEWEKLIAETGYPVVGKPSKGSSGSKNVAILKNETEVNQYIKDAGGVPVLFQEYVGSAEDEYTVGVMVSKQGGIIDSIVIRRRLSGISLGANRIIKNQPYTLSTGYSQGFVIRDYIIQDSCEKIALKIGARGPMNIQCRKVGDTIKIFEIHPRFSGTSSLRADAGFNEPDTLIRNFLLNESFGRLEYQTDVAVIRAFQSAIVPIAEMNAVARGLA